MLCVHFLWLEDFPPVKPEAAVNLKDVIPRAVYLENFEIISQIRLNLDLIDRDSPTCSYFWNNTKWLFSFFISEFIV